MEIWKKMWVGVFSEHGVFSCWYCFSKHFRWNNKRNIFAYCDRFSVCLFACLFDKFVHCAQTAEDTDTISLECDSPMSLQDRVKIWLTVSGQPLPPQILPQKFYNHIIWYLCMLSSFS